MANDLRLGLVIGGAVSSSVGAAFKKVEAGIKSLDAAGSKSRAMQRNIGDTMRLREEWRKAHAVGDAGADGLRRKLEANLSSLRRNGVEVRNLGKAYEQMGRQARSSELKAQGRAQLKDGGAGMGKAVMVGGVGVAGAAIATKVSADYGAIIRDIAIKAGIANKPEEAGMSKTIIATATQSGMARNDVADVVNALVGAGMDLTKALEYAPVAAKFVVGQGADGTDTAKMINALGQNAKITDPAQMQKALEAIAFQGQAGSFEAADMAKWFPELLAGMGKLGITGNDSVAQLGAMLQVQMKTAGSSDEAANNLKNWMEKIGSGEVVKAYKDAGIDYQKSMTTGLQNGKSTLETSFALAQKYVEKTDPKKSKEMNEGIAKISKEADPEKAKQMMVSLEQALRTGDLFADMQVKAALTAYMQNKQLYEQLKKDSASASGILDKNLAERRETSSQKWKELSQSVDDATRSVGDALRPVTDQIATTLTSVAQGIASVSDKAPGLTMGLVGAGGAIVAVMSAISTFKMGKGLFNLARGVAGVRDKRAGAGADADDDGKKDGKKGKDDGEEGPKKKAAAVAALVAAGAKVATKKAAKKDGAANDGDGDDAEDPKAALIDAGLQVFESFTADKGEGGDDGPQKVFVVNASEFGAGGAGPGDAAGRRGRGRRGRGAGGARAGRRRPLIPPAPPAPPAPPPRVSVGQSLVSGAGKLAKFGKAVPAASIFEAGTKALDVYMSSDTAEKKAEGYGEAAGNLAGTMAGAAAGAAIGSVVPVVGTLIGGLIGGYLGGMGGEFVGGKAGKTIYDETMGKSDEEKRIAAARPLVAPVPVTRNGEIPTVAKLGDVARSFEAPTEKTPLAALMKPLDPAPAPQAAPVAPKIEQSMTMAPVFNISVSGDVKDPRALAQELMPEIKRQMDDMAKQANRRQMADAPHT